MLNIIALMGRLTKDPEMRQTQSGKGVANFTIACDRNFASAGRERETDFFDIVAWGKTAEFACNYFKKGQLVAVNGTLQTRSYETKEGQKRKVYEIVADNLHFAEGKRDSAPAPQPTDDFTQIDDSEDLPF